MAREINERKHNTDEPEEEPAPKRRRTVTTIRRKAEDVSTPVRPPRRRATLAGTQEDDDDDEEEAEAPATARKAPRTPAMNKKDRPVPATAPAKSKTRRTPSKIKPPSALRLGTYLVALPVPQPESDGEDELLIKGPTWSARSVRKPRRRASHSKLGSTMAVESTRRRVRFSTQGTDSNGAEEDEDEEPQDTFAYSKPKSKARLVLDDNDEVEAPTAVMREEEEEDGPDGADFSFATIRDDEEEVDANEDNDFGFTWDDPPPPDRQSAHEFEQELANEEVEAAADMDVNEAPPPLDDTSLERQSEASTAILASFEPPPEDEETTFDEALAGAHAELDDSIDLAAPISFDAAASPPSDRSTPNPPLFRDASMSPPPSQRERSATPGRGATPNLYASNSPVALPEAEQVQEEETLEVEIVAAPEDRLSDRPATDAEISATIGHFASLIDQSQEHDVEAAQPDDAMDEDTKEELVVVEEQTTMPSSLEEVASWVGKRIEADADEDARSDSSEEVALSLVARAERTKPSPTAQSFLFIKHTPEADRALSPAGDEAIAVGALIALSSPVTARSDVFRSLRLPAFATPARPTAFTSLHASPDNDKAPVTFLRAAMPLRRPHARSEEPSEPEKSSSPARDASPPPTSFLRAATPIRRDYERAIPVASTSSPAEGASPSPVRPASPELVVSAKSPAQSAPEVTLMAEAGVEMPSEDRGPSAGEPASEEPETATIETYASPAEESTGDDIEAAQNLSMDVEEATPAVELVSEAEAPFVESADETSMVELVSAEVQPTATEPESEKEQLQVDEPAVIETETEERQATPPMAVPDDTQRTPSISPEVIRRLSLVETPKTAPRPSLSALFEVSSSSSSGGTDVDQDYLSGLVSPTTLLLSSPATARRLSALTSSGSSGSVRPQVSPASQAVRPFSTPPRTNGTPSRPPATASPLRQAATTLTSKLARMFDISAKAITPDRDEDEDSLRATPEAERKPSLDTREAEEEESSSDDSLRDTPVSERVFNFPVVAPPTLNSVSSPATAESEVAEASEVQMDLDQASARLSATHVPTSRAQTPPHSPSPAVVSAQGQSRAVTPASPLNPTGFRAASPARLPSPAPLRLRSLTPISKRTASPVLDIVREPSPAPSPRTVPTMDDEGEQSATVPKAASLSQSPMPQVSPAVESPKRAASPGMEEEGDMVDTQTPARSASPCAQTAPTQSTAYATSPAPQVVEGQPENDEEAMLDVELSARGKPDEDDEDVASRSMSVDEPAEEFEHSMVVEEETQPEVDGSPAAATPVSSGSSPRPFATTSSSATSSRDPSPPVASTSHLPPPSPARPLNATTKRQLDLSDLLVDDVELYSGEVVDLMPFINDDQPVTSAQVMSSAFAYAGQRLDGYEMALDALEPSDADAEGRPATIDPHVATPGLFEGGDTAPAPQRRRQDLAIRPPTPGRPIRGSVLIETPGTSPESSRRIPSVHRPPKEVVRSNIKLHIASPANGMPRKIRASLNGSSLMDRTLHGELSRSEDMSRSSSAPTAHAQPISPPRQRIERGSSIDQSTIRRRHGRATSITITSEDPIVAARAAAMLTQCHGYAPDSSAEDGDDSMERDKSKRLLEDAEIEISSRMDVDSVASRHRSASPFAPGPRSTSVTSGTRNRQVSNQSGAIPNDGGGDGPRVDKTEVALSQPDSDVGRTWTKDHWRLLESVLRAEQQASDARGRDEPASEEVVRVFLVAAGVQLRSCQDHWSWEKLNLRVEALRTTRCRPQSAGGHLSVPSSTVATAGTTPGWEYAGSRASSVAFEHYDAEPSQWPNTSTPGRRSNSEPPNPLSEARPSRPGPALAAPPLATSTPRNALRDLIGRVFSTGPRQASAVETKHEGAMAPPTVVPPRRERPLPPLFHDTPVPKTQSRLAAAAVAAGRPDDSQSEPGYESGHRWGAGSNSSGSSSIRRGGGTRVMEQIARIEEREQSFEADSQRSTPNAKTTSGAATVGPTINKVPLPSTSAPTPVKASRLPVAATRSRAGQQSSPKSTPPKTQPVKTRSRANAELFTTRSGLVRGNEPSPPRARGATAINGKKRVVEPARGLARATR